jgi:hypothetical protein
MYSEWLIFTAFKKSSKLDTLYFGYYHTALWGDVVERRLGAAGGKVVVIVAGTLILATPFHHKDSSSSISADLWTMTGTVWDLLQHFYCLTLSACNALVRMQLVYIPAVDQKFPMANEIIKARAFRTRPFRRTRTQTEVRNSDSDLDSDLRNRDFPTPWPKNW